MRRWPALAVFILALAAVSGSAEPALRAPALLTPEQSRAKARVDQKYRMLLSQLLIPEDLQNYTDFRDYGTYPATDYAGYTGIPAGYWVYVYPFWYVFRDSTAEPKMTAFYSGDQAAGPPDTGKPGQAPTAWTSETEDDQDEWLMLEYDAPLLPGAVRIHESWNPGAVRRVTCFTLEGREEEIWSGKDPTPPTAERGVSMIPCGIDFRTNRIKIYLDSPHVKGRNAIDAVGLDEVRGKTHWAAVAEASTYWKHAAP